MNLKLVFYPAAIIGVLFLMLALVLQRWQIVISFEPLEPQATLPLASSPISPSVTRSAESSFTESTPKPTVNAAANGERKEATSTAKPSAALPPGVLRLSNQSEHPIRVAFLAKEQASKSTQKPGYGEPAHWDFEPGEGASSGLVLSLPAGFVKLDEGDILIAFAQDGSRRYWGPFVVGETPQPAWNKDKKEWQLILSP